MSVALTLPEPARAAGQQIMGLEEIFLMRLRAAFDNPIAAVRARIHGDFVTLADDQGRVVVLDRATLAPLSTFFV